MNEVICDLWREDPSCSEWTPKYKPRCTTLSLRYFPATTTFGMVAAKCLYNIAMPDTLFGKTSKINLMPFPT
jgi:hypothetical protein